MAKEHQPADADRKPGTTTDSSRLAQQVSRLSALSPIPRGSPRPELVRDRIQIARFGTAGPKAVAHAASAPCPLGALQARSVRRHFPGLTRGYGTETAARRISTPSMETSGADQLVVEFAACRVCSSVSKRRIENP